MDRTLTIQLDENLERQLDEVVKQSGRSREELAQDALQRLVGRMTLDQLRKDLIPYAEAKGCFTDEDVMKYLS